jgi:hypothetical protein
LVVWDCWCSPGQTFCHGGLLVEGHGEKVFFAGDSGAPTGIDDYTCGNRTFLGAHRGFRRCFEIWRDTRPDYIFNQHQDRPFRFSAQELDYLDDTLAQRERLVAQLVPWNDPNFALDEWWVRTTYPYEQDVAAGATFVVQVQFTNHGSETALAQVEPALPAGWAWDKERSVHRVNIPPRTDGSTDAYCANPDKAARVWITVPSQARAGRYVIPFRVTWMERRLGQFRHAVVTVR